jgi:hypothetical protein
MNQHLCKNCKHVFEGNFCSNCGQKSHTVRLNWHFVKDELQYTFLHINKGLLYTAKQLFTRPGDTVREFIEGKRVQHYKPILLVFVLAGLNGLLTHYLNVDKIFKLIDKNPSKKVPFTPAEVFEWVTTHYALIELLLIPLISLCSWLAFKKWGYNYIENIIINCFASGQRMIFGILVFPILFLLNNSDYLLIAQSILGLPVYALTIWLYIDLYKNKDLGERILRILLFGFNLVVAMILIMIPVVLGIVYYFLKIKH